MKAFGVNLAEVYNIDVGLVNTLQVTHAWIQSEWDGAVYPSDGNAVTRLYTVNQVIVCIDKHCVWSLARGHVI